MKLKFCQHCTTQITFVRATRRWVHSATGKAQCRAGFAEEAEPKRRRR